jgi:hypothetical protein
LSEVPIDRLLGFAPEAFRWASQIAPASSPVRSRGDPPVKATQPFEYRFGAHIRPVKAHGYFARRFFGHPDSLPKYVSEMIHCLHPYASLRNSARIRWVAAYLHPASTTVYCKRDCRIKYPVATVIGEYSRRNPASNDIVTLGLQVVGVLLRRQIEPLADIVISSRIPTRIRCYLSKVPETDISQPFAFWRDVWLLVSMLM